MLFRYFSSQFQYGSMVNGRVGCVSEWQNPKVLLPPWIKVFALGNLPDSVASFTRRASLSNSFRIMMDQA